MPIRKPKVHGSAAAEFTSLAKDKADHRSVANTANLTVRQWVACISDANLFKPQQVVINCSVTLQNVITSVTIDFSST
jgi:acetamidase/formamidase